MKFLILTLALTPAFAHAKANIFCKNESGAVISALSEDGHFDCAAALRWENACFTGARAEAIGLINEISWDEEWLADAHFKGKDKIAYTFVDGPNELKEKLSMSRCDDSFFGK